MPLYRYEAIDRVGVPIHGTAEASDESRLTEILAARGQRLVSSATLSLDALIANQSKSLPRLHQLRVGEQIREALLIDLPVHEAVRAIAREPMDHPLPAVAPVLQLMAFAALGLLYAAWHYLHVDSAVVIAAGAVAFILVPLLSLFIYWNYQWRPARILNQLATRLETGQALNRLTLSMAPSELRPVLSSGLNDQTKARVAADLVPLLTGGNLRAQQFVASLIAPLFMIGTVFACLHLATIIVLPGFRDIFDSFGLELPGLTKVILNLGEFASFFGVTGWVTATLVIAAALLLIAIGLSTGRIHELMATVPMFGLAFRWTMQARVARVLAAAVRNDCDYPNAIRIATEASGFRSVQDYGRMVAEQMQSGNSVSAGHSDLSGLPMSMLLTPTAETENRRAAISESFQDLSEMLDAATVGQGRLLAMIIQLATLVVTGIVITVAVFALYLPLIKLLNDLT